MTRWEYKLIHLNVAPPSGGATAAQSSPRPPASSPASAPSTPPPQPASLFSKAYLEQEFPDFYAHPPGAGQTAQASNPVLQLQGFLNTQGRDGWCLIGLYNVGPLLLMAFRRRLLEQEPPSASADQDPLLNDILARLQRLEQDQRPIQPVSPSDGKDVWILSDEQRQALSREALCTAAEASRRLGFRSTVSLNSFLRRHGYALGLVKLGASGLAAVYDGVSSTGSRRQHRWLLVKAADLMRN